MYYTIVDPFAATVPEPLSKQISSYLASKKNRIFGPVAAVSIHSLQAACDEHREYPENVDEGYVLDASFDVTDPTDAKFCIVWSTRRLSEGLLSEVFHSDCTYKCAWNGYPLTIMGFSDKNRRFHPIILAISLYETHVEFEFILSTWRNCNPRLNFKYVMADSSEAVANAAKAIWPNIIRLMCYAHVYMVCSTLYSVCCNVLYVFAYFYEILSVPEKENRNYLIFFSP